MATLDQVIGAYRTLRAQKDETVKRHKEELAPINAQLQSCLSWVHKTMQDQGMKNTRGESGSAFLQTDIDVTTKDWPVILAYIQENNLWEFLEQRVSKTVITEYIESTKVVPPGIKVAANISCHIRK
jgi:hypothetical protein